MKYTKNILVIDDARHIRDILWFSLKQEGYRAILAENGIKGIDALFNSEEAFDLVILDVMMPKMDGFETLKKIRSTNHPASSTPVIMLTAKAQKTDVIQGMTSGADDYVVKPYKFAELLSKIKKLIG